MCFFFGGLRHKEQTFNTTVASTMSSLMAVATSSLIIPAALYSTLSRSKEPSFDLILDLSRGTSVVLLILYILYLVFQLHTHADLFEGNNEEGERRQESLLTTPESALVLVLVTVLVAVCAEYLVGSIDEIVASSGISKTFIGLILIPIVGNAAEHVTAVVVAMKDKVDSPSSFVVSHVPLHTRPPSPLISAAGSCCLRASSSTACVRITVPVPLRCNVKSVG